MSAKAKKLDRQRSFLRRHKALKRLSQGLAIVIGIIVILIVVVEVRVALQQHALQPFYNTSNISPNGEPGQLVRSEPLDVKLTNGTAERILYRTQHANGSDTFSSGMVFIPNNTNDGTPRPVVAWAHGTLGLGSQCAPSRTSNPISSIGWVNDMLAKGWVVTATDYAGFGTAGTQGYLVGGDEAHDVLNSIRAAQQLPIAEAGSRYAIWGHSQGGNSALFTAAESSSYAPELQLIGTVASAPAAELVPLLNEQYGTAADWVIGPLVATAWPAANANLHASAVLTSLGNGSYQRIANQCILPATLAGLIRTALGQKFFSTNLVKVPAWRAMAEQQSAPVLKPSQPLMVVESKTDQVVLPNTTALYIQTACKSGSDLSSLWLDKAAHQQIPAKSASQVIAWIGDRFAGKPVSSSCNQPLPVAPASASIN